MKATVLIINYGDHEEITIHENDGVAWTKLILFVNENWSASQGVVSPPADEAERARMFFARDRDSYVIAEVDLSDVADALAVADGPSRPQCPR